MRNKSDILNKSSEIFITSEEYKEKNQFNNNAFEHDLYHEEDDKVERLIRVKRFSLPNDGERWKIFEDNKVLMVIEGDKLTKKEKDFLRTVNGFNFLIEKFKSNVTNFNNLKKELKAKLKK